MSSQSSDSRLLKDAPAIGPTAARKTRSINTGTKSHDVSHGRPVQSRGWLPLPTCQNKGFPRVVSPPTRRQSWLTSGYQRGFWLGETPAGQRLKTACKRPFWRQNANRPPACADGRRGGRQVVGALCLKAWLQSQF